MNYRYFQLYIGLFNSRSIHNLSQNWDLDREAARSAELLLLRDLWPESEFSYTWIYVRACKVRVLKHFSIVSMLSANKALS